MNVVTLPAVPTEQSCTFQLPSDLEPQLEQLLAVWLGCTSWPQRFAMVRQMMHGWGSEAIDSDEATFRAEAGFRILTSWLEQLGETEIADPYQAATYRLAFHMSWQRAATEWLASDEGGAFLSALVDASPDYLAAARLHISLFGIPEE